MESCWTDTNDDCTGHLDCYSYGNTASGNECNLDEGKGYTFEDGNTQTSDGYAGYAYVTTTEFSGVPIGFVGMESDWGDICGFTP